MLKRRFLLAAAAAGALLSAAHAGLAQSTKAAGEPAPSLKHQETLP